MGGTLKAMPRLQTPHCLRARLDLHGRYLGGKGSARRVSHDRTRSTRHRADP